MNSGEITIEKSRSVEDVHQLRLMALLRDLVREKRVKGAANALGVDPRTLTTSLVRRKLSRRMSDALDRLLLTGGAPAEKRRNERIDGLEQRLQGLSDRVDTLEEEVRSGLDEVRSAVETEVNAMREELAQGVNESGRATVHVEIRKPGQGGGTATLPETARLQLPTRKRRDEPLVLTEMPEPDDEEFYGPVWPVVAEWRALRSGHPNRGRGLSWLVDEERLMEVEVALLEEHGFTLPPEKEELRGFARSGQLDWRKRALQDARRARIKRERLRWVRRILTLGLWWK